MTRRMQRSIVLAFLLAFASCLLLTGTARAAQCETCDPDPGPDDPGTPTVAVTLTLGANPTYGQPLHATVATDKPEMDGTVSIAWERTGLPDVIVASGDEDRFDIATTQRFLPGAAYRLRARVTKTDGSVGASTQASFAVGTITSALQFVSTTSTLPAPIRVKVTTPTPTAVTPTGTIRLDAGSTNLGVATLDAQGIASFDDVQPGTYDVVATYAGDGVHTPGNAAATIHVLPLPSFFQIEISDATPTQGEQVTLRVTPGSSEQHPAAGDWELSAAPTGGGTASLISEVSTSGEPWDMDITDWVRDHVGSWTLTWTYHGNPWVAASSSASAGVLTIAGPVTPPGPGTPGTPTATQQKARASLTGMVKRVRRTVTLTVVVTGGTSPTGTVQVRDGKRVVRTATLSGGRAVVRLKRLRRGRHALTATYLGSTALTGAQHRWTVRVP